VHPIERLRYVARAGAVDDRVLVEETAAALEGMHDDGAGLVMSCRRLLERNLASGPLWTLCARVLCAADGQAEADALVAELYGDRTVDHLVRTLPDDARVTVVGWPVVTADALVRRGDLHVLVVDARGEGLALARLLARADVAVDEVDESSVAAAVRASGIVLLEAGAMGADGFVATVGSYAAGAVARHAGVPVWVVAGAGRALPPRAWRSLTGRLAAGTADRPWDAGVEVVPLGLADTVVGPAGPVAPEAASRRADAPFAPELVR
jgi:hypothetical protein